MDKKDLISYWLKSSDIDFKAMKHLFKKKDYNWAMFVGHLVIEKLLKSYYVKNIDNKPPYTHNLLRLAEISALELNEEQKDFLITVTTFNINARYNDYKSEFFKTCTKEFTSHWINRICEFRKWIKELLSKK